MVDIKNIPAKLKSDCRFCVWKFEKRSGQKTKMPYNPANGDRARINDLRTFADFKTTLMTYAMGGYDGIGIAVGNGIGAFDIDHCFREDGTLNNIGVLIRRERTRCRMTQRRPSFPFSPRHTLRSLRPVRDCEAFLVCRKILSTTRQSITSTTAAKGWKCICPVRQTASSP